MSNLLFGTAFTVCLLVIVCIWLKQKRSAERKQGLKLLQALRMMIKHVQMHRGLSAIYIAGDTSVLGKQKAAAQSISRDLTNLADLDGDFIGGEDWRAMSSHWARLSVATDKIGIYENYDQHSKLIYSLLEQIRGIIHDYGLGLRAGSGERIFWYELLCMGEKLGQLRALGVICLSENTLASSKSKSVGNGGSVNFSSRVNQLCRNKVIDGIGEIEQMLKDRLLQVKVGGAANAKVKSFLSLAEVDIGQNQLALSPQEYFDKASEVLEVVYALLDEEMQRLVRLC